MREEDPRSQDFRDRPHLGLLVAVVVVAAIISDNGGIAVAGHARERSGRFAKLWCDAGFERSFVEPATRTTSAWRS